MSGKPHVNIHVKLLDVVTLSKALGPTIVNGNYECSFTHWKRLLNDVLDATYIIHYAAQQ